MMKNENAGAHCLGFAVEDIIWRGQRASIVDQRFPVGTPITTANLSLSPHSQANRPAERAPNHREQERLEEQCQPDRGMTSTSGDAQTSCPLVDCLNGTAREQPAREGSCNASSLERSGSIDAELDNTTISGSPTPHSHALVKRAFLDGVSYATSCKVTDPEAAWETSLAKARLVTPAPSSHVKPYAAATTDHTGCVHIGPVKQIEEIAASGAKGPTEVVYLYEGPSPQTQMPAFITGWDMAGDYTPPDKIFANGLTYVPETPSPQTRVDGDPARLKPIPIEAAKRIAKEYGYDQVLIYARRCHDTPEPHGEHMTTYGRTREHCDVAARIGDTLKKFMGWEV